MAFLTAAVDAVPLLKDVSAMTPDLMKTRIPALRDEGWVCLSATGLNMLARLGFEMMGDNEPKRKEYIARLSMVDWKRTAPIWRGNPVSEDGNRISTAHKSMRAGVEGVERRDRLDLQGAGNGDSRRTRARRRSVAIYENRDRVGNRAAHPRWIGRGGVRRSIWWDTFAGNATFSRELRTPKSDSPH